MKKFRKNLIVAMFFDFICIIFIYYLGFSFDFLDTDFFKILSIPFLYFASMLSVFLGISIVFDRY